MPPATTHGRTITLLAPQRGARALPSTAPLSARGPANTIHSSETR